MTGPWELLWCDGIPPSIAALCSSKNSKVPQFWKRHGTNVDKRGRSCKNPSLSHRRLSGCPPNTLAAKPRYRRRYIQVFSEGWTQMGYGMHQGKTIILVSWNLLKCADSLHHLTIVPRSKYGETSGGKGLERGMRIQFWRNPARSTL